MGKYKVLLDDQELATRPARRTRRTPPDQMGRISTYSYLRDLIRALHPGESVVVANETLARLGRIETQAIRNWCDDLNVVQGSIPHRFEVRFERRES